MRYKLILIAFITMYLIFCVSPQKKIEEARNKDPRHQYALGLVHLNRGDIDEAIRYLNMSLSLSPNYYLALNALGLAYFMKGNPQESTKYLQKSLAINPTFSEARNNLGMVYQEMGFIDKAEREFIIATADKNYNSRENPYYNLAKLYLDKEKLDEALEYVQKALELNKKMAMAHNLKGTIHEKLKNFDEAIESYTEALKIFPQDINLNFNLAVAYFKNNEFKKAKEIFENILSKATDPEMRENINLYLKIINKGSSPKKLQNNIRDI